jgi:hypothetical protein
MDSNDWRDWILLALMAIIFAVALVGEILFPPHDLAISGF